MQPPPSSSTRGPSVQPPPSSTRSPSQVERRVSISKNVKKGEAPIKLISIPPGAGMMDVLRTSSAALGMDAKKLFLKGVLVEDIAVVRDNDSLVVSAGEDLYQSTKAVPLFRISVMGPGGVGKSAITSRFVTGRFIRTYDPTIEDSKRHQFEIDGEVALLDILDTAGQEDFITLRSQWMVNKDGFVFVYSVDDRHSFEMLSKFWSDLSQMHPEKMHPSRGDGQGGIPLVVVANKADLRDRRTVSESEGRTLARSFNNASYQECSAMTGDGVNNIFDTLVREIRKVQKPRKKKRKCLVL
eukprot:gnl/Spiro4/8837_TR4652_c0_g2_i1.p1 gnl/Spiro4/8837_TR4652_c0_g2~~gnl/Spiro4/8837_TR4652_c0_g2_i1.p1  ORF type:complete len:298 (+),score=46.79 gnl/Spiro4/8837_TR4652_c0_g2_i1:82-975(+)